jgi:Domain of unknown function (DUF4116)
MSAMNPPNLTSIPQEVLTAYSRFYHWRDLLHLSHANRFFNSIHSHDVVWETWFRDCFPESQNVNENFKQAFLQHYSDELQRVKLDPEAIKNLSHHLKSDKHFVMAAVLQFGWALQYADVSLKSDFDVVMSAVSQHGLALQFANNKLQQDFDVVMKAVLNDGDALQYSNLKNNKNIVVAAVSQNGWALEYADDSFKKDKDVVKRAVSNTGWALEYADEELQQDDELMMISRAQKRADAMKYSRLRPERKNRRLSEVLYDLNNTPSLSCRSAHQ